MPAELESAVGGLPAHWVYGGGRYTPSYEGQTWIADLYLHRAMRQRGAYKAAGACLVMHGGCNVNSIYDTQTKPYSSPEYGRWSNSEAFLFYTNCVALLSRAKGFNDAPNGFTEGFRVYDRANFGSCWLAYFNAQAADAGLTTWNVQRKRAYFWSLNGDWTLRLRNRNGYGLLGLDAQLSSVAVHPNQAWIDNWNYDARTNPIRGIGDFDGDGVDELIVTSDWGIGILRHDGVSFRTLMQAPRDTWFGGWRWDATCQHGAGPDQGRRQFHRRRAPRNHGVEQLGVCHTGIRRWQLDADAHSAQRHAFRRLVVQHRRELVCRARQFHRGRTGPHGDHERMGTRPDLNGNHQRPVHGTERNAAWRVAARYVR